ncbi:hypothetical protein [Bacillus sp. JCM 19041]|uniref:hypothetical protein n=1 Tax=Bacillus sp. JCM 19041 TaxID=1460637 RepID=UPI000A9AB92E
MNGRERRKYVYTGTAVCMLTMLAACGGDTEDASGSGSNDVVELSFWRRRIQIGMTLN